VTLINVERSPNHKFYKFECNALNLHDTEVERSPNLELYTFVCNTHNLHDTEVESSPNLELYTFVCNTLSRLGLRSALISVMKIKCITYKCIKFKIRTGFYCSVIKIKCITYTQS
jgi:hypothetical protein